MPQVIRVGGGGESRIGDPGTFAGYQTGSDVSQGQIVASGRIMDDGTISNGFGIRSVTKTDVGSYRVVVDQKIPTDHFAGFTSDPGPILTSVGNENDPDGFAQIDVSTFDLTGTLQDSNFRFLVVKW